MVGLLSWVELSPNRKCWLANPPQLGPLILLDEGDDDMPVLLPIQLGQTGKQKLCNQRRASLPKQETYQILAQQSSSSAIRICSMRRGLNCHLGTIGDQIILLTDWGYLVTIADQIGDNCWWDQIGDKLGDNWWDCLLQWWRLIYMTLIHWRTNSSVQQFQKVAKSGKKWQVVASRGTSKCTFADWTVMNRVLSNGW